MKKKFGKLVIVSAPSGCGKTTVVRQLLRKNKRCIRSVSYTTRPPRSGEKNGRDYFFISKDEFNAKKRRGFFLETAPVFHYTYGTSKEFVQQYVARGKYVVLIIDIQGMKKVCRRVKGKLPLITIFIMPPSIEELGRRLVMRKTERKSELECRLKMAKKEMAASSLYQYAVVNQRVSQTVKEIEEILKHEYTH
ncbi:MAG: guanylate kinase [Omnitrophica bacterium RIFCSPLOWO2_12_FULL_44_17]|uniref:Guanylate kinase n=1 Tax=Candidatus Danuiimicrobium aquiferis TaxID=1801832 RepID=A0A1G1KS62_9BACT|nr:MAG: guanylate kinase [Omnitrophica bacterium RIFCSPHIGHO2_02_FULL_45_28]OGW91888.1 MAG: guanylate kinase [Omnitrophica bacterium RIFCSPHIGHO2_12_FULL_44_12]OGW95652.1 MAG: guanylate kinase [Omnitrophica bacterium RIFCSPLOWO2_12_FULL_44_17]OGX03737.1 MAG: guanylate kinase [Omnitrophica bacterium RIFCSPLOWO2_02_FULL_44_11]